MPAIWGKITAEEILTPISGSCVSGDPRTVFSGLSTDSRHTGPGDLFWVLIGDRFNGHDFVSSAVNQGAVGVVIQKDHPLNLSHRNDPVIIAVDDTLKALGDLAVWWRHQHEVQVVAVTGSTGKTTTKEMTAQILEVGGSTLVSQGNFNNLIGLPVTLLQMERRHKNAVVEMGMNRPGEIARLTEIADPNVGVITNVGMAHLEGLKDIQGVAGAKVELVERISSDGQIILNGDDKLLMETAARFQKNTVTFGFGRHNDIRCTKLQNLGLEGSSFYLHYQDKSMPVRLNVPGLQNVSNALAAAAAGLSLHESGEHIVNGLSAFSGVPGRFTLVALAGNITLVDDTYNANPSSLKAALKSVAAMADKRGRILVGLGEMMELGDATVPAHLQAGRMVAETNAQYFVAMGDHAPEMIKGAVESGMNPARTFAVQTHGEMVEFITGKMEQGDLIFIKGSRRMNLGRVVDEIREKW